MADWTEEGLEFRARQRHEKNQFFSRCYAMTLCMTKFPL